MRAIAWSVCHDGQCQTEPFAWPIVLMAALRWKNCDPDCRREQWRHSSPKRKRLAGSNRIAGCAMRPIRSGRHPVAPRGACDSMPGWAWMRGEGRAGDARQGQGRSIRVLPQRVGDEGGLGQVGESETPDNALAIACQVHDKAPQRTGTGMTREPTDAIRCPHPGAE